MIPDFTDYKWSSSIPDFSQTSEVSKSNFSLALQVSGCWLKNHGKLSNENFTNGLMTIIDEKFINAFKKCEFEGRFQKICYDNINLFLDGAHTIDSIQICLEWFKKQIHDKNSIKILVFNVTGDRDSLKMLEILNSMNFNHVYFTTNIATAASDNGKCGEFYLINSA
jgi:folylpolyglutamate synthase/dihydropteroate synthase